jgi:membrane protein YdbS with pleckstrin-like domain
MKATEKKPTSRKLISCLILAIVAAGTVSLYTVADLDKGCGIMGILFIAFLGAIIAVQLIPGLMLFGMMLKGLASLFHKGEAYKETK